MIVLSKEAMPKTQAEILDDNHAIWALGTELLPLHGESESKLSHTRRAERIRARSELLRSVLKPESVRRMVRKAGISSYATSSPVGEEVDVVLKTLQQIADVILFNVSFEICRLCEYLKKKNCYGGRAKRSTEEVRGETARRLRRDAQDLPDAQASQRGGGGGACTERR